MTHFKQNWFQNLPNFKGKWRLAKFLFNKKINAKVEEKFKAKNGLKFYVPNLIENVYFELFFNGTYETEIVNFFIKQIPQNGIFIDVGANIGSISIFLANARPDLTIYAFEAAPEVYKYLEKNIEANNFTNIKAFNYAIHKTDAIQLPFYSPTEKSGKGSFSNVYTNEAVLVYTKNLDNFFIQNNILPNAIKVDVEGYEKLIFESMSTFLKNNNNAFVLFEFEAWAEDLVENSKSGDAQQLMKNYGYNLYELKEEKLISRDFIQTKGRCKNLVATKNVDFFKN